MITWYIHYKTRGVAGLLAVSTLQLAIKNACELLDQGTEVSQIEGSGGLRGMNADEIMLACAVQKAKKAPH